MTEPRRKTPFLDPDHPMFRRPWVRWATTLFPLGWAGVEFWMQSPFFGILFGAAGAYAGWKLLLNR